MVKVTIYIPEDNFNFINDVIQLVDKKLSEEYKYVNIDVTKSADKEFLKLKNERKDDINE